MSTQVNTNAINIPIVKRKNSKSVITSIGLILSGIAFYIFSTTIHDTTSSLYMFCAVSGFSLLFIGLLRLFVGGKETVYLPTKSPVKSYALYFESLSGDELVRLIEQGRFDEIRTARRKESGPVRLDVQRSRDDCFIALQVMQYVPYTYENVSCVHCFEQERASEVAACVGNPVK